jgi:hypothetical protein
VAKLLVITLTIDPADIEDESTLALLDMGHSMGLTDEACLDQDGTLTALLKHAGAVEMDWSTEDDGA